jgi:hypothetical protein
MHQSLDAANGGGNGGDHRHGKPLGQRRRGIAERASADDDGLGSINLDAGQNSFSERLGQVIGVFGELNGVARRESDPV